MSTRSVLVAALAVVAAIAVYLLLGRDEVSEPSTPTPAVSSEGKSASLPTPTPAPSRSRAPAIEPQGVLVRGRVEAGGQPVAGAVVTLTPADDDAEDEPRSVRTNADGSFELTRVTPGRYAASATAADHLPAVLRNIDVQDGVSITLTLSPGGHPLRGTISDATGGTIEGALVRLTPLSGVVSLRRLDGFGTLSTEDGTYTVHVAPGRYRVDVSHADYATDSRAVEVGPGAQSQDFSLVPMGVIEGVVRKKGGGPIPRAWVSWQRERQQTIVPGHRMSIKDEGGVVRADDEGRFVVRGLRPGAIHLQARGADAASVAPTVVPLAMAEHVTGVELWAETAYEVRGRVVAQDEPDRGLSGVSVSVRLDGPGHPPHATTDAEGMFTLTGVTPGPHMLSAQADGWRMADDVRVEIEDKTPPEVTLQMERAPVIAGRVEPAQIAEVAIEIRPENIEMGMGRSVLMGSASTKSAEDGSFELGLSAPGRTTVVARVADGRAGEVTLDVGAEGVDDVVITLEDRATIRGTVLSGGAAVAQAMVSLQRVKEPGATDVRLVVNGLEVGHDTGVTTEDGRFEIGGVAAGQFEVKVTDRYGEPLPVQTGSSLTVVDGKDVDGHDLVVDAHDGVIRGVVKTADGDPAPDVWVEASVLSSMMGPGPSGSGPDSGSGSRSEMRMVVSDGNATGSRSRPPVLTDEDGRFEITGLRDAEYELSAEGGGGEQRARVTARPGQEATVELAPLSTIEGTVTIDGQAAKSFSVRLQGPSSTMTHVRDDGGHFEFPRLDPGTYTVSVSGASGRGSAEVTVAAGETATADVTLETLLNVTGVVVDAEGKPVEGARIMLGDAEGGSISVTSHGDEGQNKTDEEGRFEVQCAPGPRVLLAMSPGSMRPMLIHRFTAEAGEDVDVGQLKEGDMGMLGGEPESKGP